MLWIIGCSVFVVVFTQKRKKTRREGSKESKPCVVSVFLL